MVGFAFLWAVAFLTYLLPPFEVYHNLLTGSLTRNQAIFLTAATLALSVEFLLARHFFCRYACAVGLFQSLAWMANDRAMVVGFDTRRAAACATCPSVCDEACPMRLKPRTIKRRMFTCTECGECIAACTRVQGGDPPTDPAALGGGGRGPAGGDRAAGSRSGARNPAPEIGPSRPGRRRSDPMEEQVGALWHRVITRFADRRYPQAAARLQDLAPTLGILFRALGGDGGLQVEAADPKAHGARRGFAAMAGGDRRQGRPGLARRALAAPARVHRLLPGRRAQPRPLPLADGALAVGQPGDPGGDPANPVQTWLLANQWLTRRALDDLPGLRAPLSPPGGRAPGPAPRARRACPPRRRPASG